MRSVRADVCSAGLNTYDRHLLREWLGMLLLVLCATMGLLLVQVLYDDFRTLRDYGAPAADIARYVVITIPSFLALVLPLALLISLLFVLGKLHRANEFTALRAAGVGTLRITVPIWIVGLGVCGLAAWLNTTVVPWSVEQSQAMHDALQFRKQSGTMSPDRIGAIYSVGFDNPAAGRMWFFNRYSEFTGRAYGVSVSQLDERRRELSRIDAAEAWFDVAKGWTFLRGRELRFDADTGEQLASAPFAERQEPRFREDPKLLLLIDRKPADLSLPQMRRLMDYFAVSGSPKGTPYAVRYFSLIADTLAPLIMIAIAIPFAMTGVRVNPAVGVSKSIGLFFLYYVLSNVAGSLATQRVLEPAIAAWVPNVGLIAVAIWLFARMR